MRQLKKAKAPGFRSEAEADEAWRRAVALPAIAVVIPCFRAAGSIDAVVAAIPAEVALIVCVDDASDDATAERLRAIAAREPRLRIVSHARNRGVGGATVTGYRRALDEGAEILVKMDSDGQMDPAMILPLVAPIANGEADYAKGNRFFDLAALRGMPATRMIGNAGLSFLTKLTTGYWDLFDPTNGFTALHAEVARALPLGKLHPRYFFESDILFRLSTLRARVVEVPMAAIYRDEVSGLNVARAFWTFPALHARNLGKRILYNYFLRGFSAASLCLVTGIPLTLFGAIFGILSWVESAATQMPATSGTVMLSALPLLLGIQILLTFLQLDVAIVPDRAIHGRARRLSVLAPAATASEDPAAAAPPADPARRAAR